MTDQAWMQLALAEARAAAQAGEIPVGAVIVRDGQVLARAHNTREATGDPTAHAEMICIREAARALGTWRLNGCTLYVTLEPCPMCAGALLMSRLTRCVYGAADLAQGCCGSVYDLPADPALGGTTAWQAGVEADACAAALSAFLQSRRTSHHT